MPLRCMPIYALLTQGKSPMRISVHIGRLRTPILSGTVANRVSYITPYPAFLPSICWILSIKGVVFDTLSFPLNALFGWDIFPVSCLPLCLPTSLFGEFTGKFAFVASAGTCRSTQSGSWQATLLGAVSCSFSWPAPSNWNHDRLPRKVSDWTVIYFYPRHTNVPGVQRKAYKWFPIPFEKAC